ncbi:MAG: hypothetical protein EOM08_01140 [Clostridia bacterium]|nr:hypothetical protein [Clostridia bacterium]NCC75020.1 hypothetical protein [Clostridia bacterium]
MTLKEGICPNCGSLLQLDDKNTQGHCLFCDAVFESDVAYAIAVDSAGVTFPNLPQPKYEGPNLNPQLNNAQFAARATQVETTKKQKAKVEVKPAQPAYVPKNDIKLPDLRLTVKTRLKLTGAAVLALAIIVALSAPPIMKRNDARIQLLAVIPQISPVTTDVDKTVVIHGLSNQRLELALPAAITADEATALFNRYADQRAAITGEDAADFSATRSDLIVKIVTPEGGYLIEQPKSQAALEDGSAIQVLG